jgi:hypothetical protein
MANPEKQRAMAEKFIKGKISIRDWREQMNTVMGMCARPPLPIGRALVDSLTDAFFTALPTLQGGASARLPR